MFGRPGRLGVAAALLIAGCGGGSSLVDAPPSVADAADIDARVVDAPMIDAPTFDAAMIDAPTFDAAMIDAPTFDASPADASPPDAVPPDAAPPDAFLDAAPFTLGVSTLAGGAEAALIDGSRDVARFANPVNTVLGPDGKIYVADFDNGAIRRVDTAGTVETVYVAPASFQRPFGLAFDAAGALYVSTDNDDTGQHSTLSGTVWKLDVTAKTATVVVRAVGRPRGLAVLPDGRIVLSDYVHAVVRLLDPQTQAITLLAGAWDVPGYANGAGSIARFNGPYGVAVIAGPTLVVADYENQRIRTIALDGTTATLAGDGTADFLDGAAAGARFHHPVGVAADAAGTIYLTDTDNYRIRRIAGGSVDTVAGNGVAGFHDDDNRLAAELYGIEGLCATADGSKLYVADGSRGDPLPYNRVRLVTLTP